MYKANKANILEVQKGKVHVATYQLPVGLGDCSVHLLVDQDGQIQSGFIMDGGRNADGINAGEVIEKGLEAISEAYLPSKLFLRAWVVTHWDDDHFKGVESLLEAESSALKSYFVANPVLYAASNKFPNNIESLLKQWNFRFVIGIDAVGQNFFGIDAKFKLPEFFCVGADGYAYPVKNKKIALDPKNENERSILSLILWRDENAKMSRFSYFCGGDGNPDLELGWVVKDVLNQATVTVMKLDHHGSAKEFQNGKVVEKMHPGKVIVTPGHQYGHPCWDVVHGIARLYEEWGADDTDKPLYTTRLPYWADSKKADEWNQKDVNVSVSKTSRIGERYGNNVYLEGQNFNDLRSDDFNNFLKSVYGGGDQTKKKTGRQKKQPVGKSETTRTRTTTPVDPNSDICPRFIAAEDDGELTVPLLTDSFAAYLMEESQREPDDVRKKVDKAVEKDKGLSNKRAALDRDDQEDELSLALATMEDKGAIVSLAILLWNSLSLQKLDKDPGRSRFYMLQLFSTNDDGDGEINVYNWSDMSRVR